jgi:NAD+--asparagine ADP-ribosyltransferase
MKLKTDTDYDVNTLNKLYNETIGYESDKNEFNMIMNKYFVGGFYRPKLNPSYVIEEEDIKKLNIDVEKLKKCAKIRHELT